MVPASESSWLRRNVIAREYPNTDLWPSLQPRRQLFQTGAQLSTSRSTFSVLVSSRRWTLLPTDAANAHPFAPKVPRQSSTKPRMLANTTARTASRFQSGTEAPWRASEYPRLIGRHRRCHCNGSLGKIVRNPRVCSARWASCEAEYMDAFSAVDKASCRTTHVRHSGHSPITRAEKDACVHRPALWRAIDA